MYRKWVRETASTTVGKHSGAVGRQRMFLPDRLDQGGLPARGGVSRLGRRYNLAEEGRQGVPDRRKGRSKALKTGERKAYLETAQSGGAE